MSQETYIAAIALGPVGSFIGGGRRSRDLWFGSRFLSEATRWAAYKLWLHREEVTLILPTPDRIGKSFLEPSQDRDRGPTISNKILCRIKAQSERVRELLDESRKEAHRFLADEIRNHKKRLAEAGISDPRQLEQHAAAIENGDFIEFYAAFAMIEKDEEKAIETAFDLLDGRKAARTFGVPQSDAGRPKCSLDAGWDSALIEEPSKAKSLFLSRQKLGIRPDERLSPIGLTRRLAVLRYAAVGLLTLPFPPLAQVAADAWLAAARKQHPDVMGRIHAAFRQLFDRARGTDREAALVLASPARRPGSRGDAEPEFDASIYFEGALKARRRELDLWGRKLHIDPSELPFRLLDDIAEPVHDLQTKLGTPSPYFVLLEADGDGVGEAIKNARGDKRIELAQALYLFADEAWKIVDRHYGCTFYCGGDELAAYVPLDQALSVVRALAACYEHFVRPHAPPSPYDGRRTSLSAGLVMAHAHDDLRVTRAHASDALNEAKERRRDSLDDQGQADERGYVMVYQEPRGGSRRSLCGPIENVASRVADCVALLRDQRISVSTAHDLLKLYDQIHPQTEQRHQKEQRSSKLGLHMGKAVLPQKQRRSGMGPGTKTGDGTPEEQKSRERLDALERNISDWGGLLDLATALLLATRIHPVDTLRCAAGETP